MSILDPHNMTVILRYGETEADIDRAVLLDLRTQLETRGAKPLACIVFGFPMCAIALAVQTTNPEWPAERFERSFRDDRVYVIPGPHFTLACRKIAETMTEATTQLERLAASASADAKTDQEK